MSAEKISESDEIKEIVIKIQNDVGKLTKEKNVNSLWISLLPIFIALLAGFLALIQIKKNCNYECENYIHPGSSQNNQ